MAQKRGVALSKTSAFKMHMFIFLFFFDADRTQQSKDDSVLTRSNILCFFYDVD